MSKAILVIDIPKRCTGCPLHFLDTPDNNTIKLWCGYNCKSVELNNNKIGNRPDWCPLKHVPEKKVVKQYQGNGVYGFKTAEEAHFAMGWNDCIDEILKEGAVE